MTTVALITITATVVVLFALRRTLRRFVQDASKNPRTVTALVLFPTLVGASALGVRPVSYMLLVLALSVQIAAGKNAPPSASRPLHTLVTIVALVLPLALAPNFDRILLSLSSLALLWTVVRFYEFDRIIVSLIDGVGLYLIANVVAEWVGVESVASSVRTTGLQSSLGGERTFYPLTTALGIPPLMAAIYVAALLACFTGSPLRRLYRLIALACGIQIMIGANTRVALVVAVILALAILVSPSSLRRAALPITALSLSISFIYPVLVNFLVRPVVSTLTSAVPILSRGNTSSDVSLAGRDQIWELAFRFWQQHAGVLTAPFGWGAGGQRTSGASAEYGPRLAGLNSDPLSLSVHNSAMQQLFDAGLLGLVALSISWVLTLRVLSSGTRNGRWVHLIALSATLAAVWGASTEVTLAPAFGQEPFWVFLTIALAAARSTDSTLVEPAGPLGTKHVTPQVDNPRRRTDSPE